MGEFYSELCNLLPAFILAAIIFYEIGMRNKKRGLDLEADEFTSPTSTRLLS